MRETVPLMSKYETNMHCDGEYFAHKGSFEEIGCEAL
jgi:hypothetical protein